MHDNVQDNIPWTLQSLHELAVLCYLSLNLLYISRKTQKQVKFTAFFLGNESHFLSLTYFFPHKITPRKHFMPMYLRCSNSIQKWVPVNILFFAVGITFSVLMFQFFTRILLLKLKILSSHISTKNWAIRAFFDNKTY
jgi:hypothetical protein